MERLGTFKQMFKNAFWTEVDINIGLLRWGVAAYQRALMSSGAMSSVFPTGVSLTCPRESFASQARAEGVLSRAIKRRGQHNACMGGTKGDDDILDDFLAIIFRMFSPIGCQSNGEMLQPPTGQDSTLSSLGDTRMDTIGENFPAEMLCVVFKVLCR